MTGCILIAALALVSPMEYPFKCGNDYVPLPPPVHYFNVRPGKAPERCREIARPTPPDLARKFEHAIEGHELHAFWEKPDPEPFSGVDPRKGYSEWLEWCRQAGPDPGLGWSAGKMSRTEVGRLVTEFVKERSGHKAFELFIEMACNKEAPPFSMLTREECEYFLRFAANHGSWRALEFFDGNGELKTGKEYDGVLKRIVEQRHPLRYPSGLAGAPGNGMPGTFSRYDADELLKSEMAKYGLEAWWFDYSLPQPPDCNAERYAQAVPNHFNGFATAETALPPRLPILAYRPKAAASEAVPLVVYVAGSGEQGEDLKLQFRQRACLEKVTSAGFQSKHPAYFVMIMPPRYGNSNMMEMGGYLAAEYNDMLLAFVRSAESPRIDASRIYLTGLGSGGTAVGAMAKCRPGRYAAVAPVWSYQYFGYPNASGAGSWRFYNTPLKTKEEVKKDLMERMDKFAEDVRAAGGECEYIVVPEKAQDGRAWWDGVWSSDELWDWAFSKRLQR